MEASLNYLRELNTASVLLRLFLAMLFGGVIGMERGRKRRAAGFRTYMLVCLGAAMTMLLGQYEQYMLDTAWSSEGGVIDVARFGAQVINGIGFLGAGTVIVTGKQEIKGLTTAAGLWTCACTGLAIGAGFYECVLLAFGLILLVIRVFPTIEGIVIENARNMNIYIEFDAIENVGEIINYIKGQDIQIYDVDIDSAHREDHGRLNAVFSIRLRPHYPHARLLVSLSELEGIRAVDEV